MHIVPRGPRKRPKHYLENPAVEINRIYQVLDLIRETPLSNYTWDKLSEHYRRLQPIQEFREEILLPGEEDLPRGWKIVLAFIDSAEHHLEKANKELLRNEFRLRG